MHAGLKEIVKVNCDDCQLSFSHAERHIQKGCGLRVRIKCDIVYIVTSLSPNFHFLFVIQTILRNVSLYF